MGILGECNSNVKSEVLNTIANIGEEAVPALIEVLNEDVSCRVEDASSLLYRLREHSFPVLISMLQDSDSAARLAAVTAFNNMRGCGTDISEAVPALIEILKDGNPQVRIKAAYSLGNTGVCPHVVPIPSSVAPALVNAFDDPDVRVRRAIASALGKVGEETETVEALLIALENDREIAKSVIDALGWVGARPGVLDALIEALDDEDVNIRFHACVALGRIGKEAEPALPKLNELAKHDSETVGRIKVREKAKKAIENIERTIKLYK